MTVDIFGNKDEVLEERVLFNGNAHYSRFERTNKRGIINYHVMIADLGKFDIVITKSPRNVMTVPTFLTKYGVQIAVNGDGWTSYRKGRYWYIRMAGESASEGKSYGNRRGEQSFYFDENNIASFLRPKKIWNALAFPNVLVESGEVSRKIKRMDVDPRTAIGFNQDSSKAIMVTADGKETYNMSRTGMNFTEMAQILVYNGAWIGANMDGGGSTTMVIEDAYKKPEILNVPCGENLTRINNKIWRLRSVANHFGLKLKNG